jgi:eukaryotic-like serine/threonine-protein kinase
MRCASPETLLVYLEHRATAEERQALQVHLDVCPTCRETVAALASLGRVGSGVEPEPTSEIGPGSTVHRYEIESLIGRGGMGSVYVAFDPKLDRRVALKLLDADFLDSSVPSQWVSEARAMAQVSHPNVVEVFDAGVDGDTVFIAMERVVGVTLRTWMAGGHRWPAVLEVMSAAGRGLAAAHAAGLVHRDFKPENVLVESQRNHPRVRVTDFGLAVSEKTPESSRDESSIEEEPRVLAGTLTYMAPEQLVGAKADVASDQFAFCVTLYEALFGRRPFPGTSRSELLDAMSRPLEIPRTKTPRWLTDVLARGLASDPPDRHASMGALLDRLRRGGSAARRRRWSAAGVVVVCGAVVAGVASDRFGPRHSCDAASWLGDVWEPRRLERIEAAFAGTGSTHAEHAWDRSRATLERYVVDLASAYTASCASPDEDDAQADRRLRCLTRGRDRLDAVARSFESADRSVVQHSLAASRALPPPALCASPPEIDPPSADVHEDVERVRGVIETAKGLLSAGRRQEAADLLEPEIEVARSLDYPPVLAQILATMGSVLESLDAARAQAALEEALLVAEERNMDLLAAKIRVTLVYATGHESGQGHRALPLIRAAEAAITRAGEPQDLAAKLDYHTAVLLFDEGEPSAAEARADVGLQRIATEEVDDSGLQRRLLQARGTARLELRRTAEGLADLERALQIGESDLGATHPHVDQHRFMYARGLAQAGASERALEIFEDLLAYRIAEDGRHAQSVAAAHSAIALVLTSMNRDAEAIEHHRACIDVWEHREPSPRPDAGQCMLNLGNTLGKTNRCAEAVQWYRRARDELSRTAGAQSRWVGMAWTGMGHCAFEEGDLDTARDAYVRALDLLDAYERPEVRGYVRLCLARVHHGQGDEGRARALATEAKAILIDLEDSSLADEVDATVASWDDAARTR